MTATPRSDTGLADHVYDGPVRAACSAALGHALAGGRASVRTTGAALAAAVDLIAEMVARRAAVLLQVDCRDDDAGYHLAADSGAVLLCARDAREAEVLALVGRRIAEAALLPVVVGSPELPRAPTVAPGAARRYVGLVGDLVPAPTPVQRLVFGERRRRLPRWFDLDQPALLGADLGAVARVSAKAGAAPFAYSEVPELVQQAFAALGEASLPSLSPCSETQTTGADLVIVAEGAATAVAEQVAQELTKAPRVGVVGIRCLRPLAASTLQDALRGREAVLVLERGSASLAGDGPLTREVRAACDRALAAGRRGGKLRRGKGWREQERPRLHAARFDGALDAADLAATCRTLRPDAPEVLHLGVDFAPAAEALPKRRVLHEALARAVPGLDALGVRAAAAPPARPAVAAEVPAALQPAVRARQGFASLARFWDQSGALCAADSAAALTPEPLLTAAVVPACSATLREPAPDRTTLPEFHPERCTGCGACWTACPDGAIATACLAPAAFVDAGIAASGAEGLRQLAGRLATVLGGAFASDARPHTLAQALQPAWPDLLARAKPTEERRAALEAAFAAFVATVGDLPLAEPEALAPAGGQGELLTLGIDPTACQACGLCVTVCEAEALASAPRTADTVAAGKARWRTIERLPRPAEATVGRLRRQESPGAAAVAGLLQSSAWSLGRGALAEPGAGDQLALRLCLRAFDVALRPARERLGQQIDDLRGKLGEAIRAQLAGALPVEDLEALSEGVDLLGRGDVGLSALASRLDEVCGGGRVDTRRLGELLDCARSLADLRWRLDPGGGARAVAGVVVAAGGAAAWARSFPWNPFATPVLSADASTALDTARGLAEGVLAAVLADVGALRTARAALMGRADQMQVEAALTHLTPADLTADEQALIAPILVVGDAAAFCGNALGALTATLAQRLPIVVLALADADPRSAATRSEPALLAALHRSACVAQSSVAAPDHLHASVEAAVRWGRGFLAVHAPSPTRNGFAADATLAQAGGALAARAWALFRFDPAAAGVFGTRLDVVPVAADDAEQVRAFVAWARGEARFAPWFTPLAADATGTTPLDEYLGLPAAQRTGRRVHCDASDGRVELAPELLACAAERQQAAQLLQELAGVRTPFTARLRDEIEAATAARHAEQLAAAAREAEARLQQVRDEVTGEMLGRLRERLVALALRGGGG